MLKEIGLNKKQTDSDFIKSLPSHPGKELEIQKGLGKLRDIKRSDKKSNNNNNNNNNDDDDDGGGGGGDLFTPTTTTPQNKNNSFIPKVPTFNDIFNPLPE